MSEVKPALTPHLEMAAGDPDGDEFFGYVMRDGGPPQHKLGDLVIGWNDEPMRALPPEGRHALAALCLHGQPFGFRVDDVWVIRQAAIEARGIHAEHLRDLADRIAALLPPLPEVDVAHYGATGS